MGASGAMLYSAQSSSSGLTRSQEHDVNLGQDSSPSRPISSPITPSSAALTRHLHNLMPLDGYQYNSSSPFSSTSNSINSSSLAHHSASQALHASAIHSSVIHENNAVAKMLANVHAAAENMHLNESANEHNNANAT